MYSATAQPKKHTQKLPLEGRCWNSAKAGNNLVSFGHWLQAQTQNPYRKPLNQNNGNPAPANAHGMLRKDTANRPHMGFTGAPSDSDTLGSKGIGMSPVEGLRREGKAAALYTTGINLLVLSKKEWNLLVLDYIGVISLYPIIPY